MILAHVAVTGICAAIAASLAWIAGAPLSLILGSYFLAGFLLPGLLLLRAGLRPDAAQAEPGPNQQIEREMAALRESAVRDTRLGAGSPDCLAPVLYRSLMRREDLLGRNRVHSSSDSEYILHVGDTRAS